MNVSWRLVAALTLVAPTPALALGPPMPAPTAPVPSPPPPRPPATAVVPPAAAPPAAATPPAAAPPAAAPPTAAPPTAPSPPAASPPTSRTAAPPDAPARVAVEPPACPVLPYDARVFGELLAIELRADGVERVATAASAAAVLRIEQPACEAPRLLLVVEDRATGKTVGRAVDLGPIEAGARARWLALSAAELLRASWVELVLLRPAAVDPLTAAMRARLGGAYGPPVVAPPAPGASGQPGATGAPPRAAASPPRADGAGAFVGVVARSYPSWQGGLLGVTAGAALPWGDTWSWRLDAHGLRGEAFDALGRVALWQGSAGAALLAGTAPGAVRMQAGVRLEVGAGRVSGEAEADGVRSAGGTRAVASAGALAALTGAVSEGVRVFGAIEPGLTFAGLTARADGRKVGGLAGPYAEVTVGVELRP